MNIKVNQNEEINPPQILLLLNPVSHIFSLIWVKNSIASIARYLQPNIEKIYPSQYSTRRIPKEKE